MRRSGRPWPSAARSAAPGERRRERARTIRGSRAPASSAPACRSRAACSRLRAGCAGAPGRAPPATPASREPRPHPAPPATARAPPGDPPRTRRMRPLPREASPCPARPRHARRRFRRPDTVARQRDGRCADLRTACRAGSTRSGAPRSRAGRPGDPRAASPDRRRRRRLSGPSPRRRKSGSGLSAPDGPAPSVEGRAGPWRAGLRRHPRPPLRRSSERTLHF